MKNRKPIILLDVDGVLVQWQSGLPFFCSANNLCTDKALEMCDTEEFMNPVQIFGVNDNISTILMRKYNESKYIRYLNPYSDAIKFFTLYRDQFDFIAVTALSSNEDAIMNRLFNLNTLFPKSFIDIRSCNFMESKEQMFRELRHIHGDRIVAFVDDLAANIDSAYTVFKDDIKYFQINRSVSRPRLVSDYTHFTSDQLHKLPWGSV